MSKQSSSSHELTSSNYSFPLAPCTSDQFSQSNSFSGPVLSNLSPSQHQSSPVPDHTSPAESSPISTHSSPLPSSQPSPKSLQPCHPMTT